MRNARSKKVPAADEILDGDWEDHEPADRERQQDFRDATPWDSFDDSSPSRGGWAAAHRRSLALHGLLPKANSSDDGEMFVELECLADITLQPVEPVWGSVLTKGAVTVLAGEPCVGKSSVALAIAAAVTQGRRGPHIASPHESDGDSLSQPQGVIICSPSQERPTTLVRRLVSAGANLSLIQTIKGVGRLDDDDDGQPSGTFQIDRHLETLESELMALQGGKTDFGLVVVDPFSLGFGGGARQAKQLHELVLRLVQLARDCDVAVLLVCDALPLNDAKRARWVTSAPAVERAAQSVWVLERDPHSPERRLLLPAKSNCDEMPTGQACVRVNGTIAWQPAPILLTDQDFRATFRREGRDSLRSEEATELSRATDWLQKRLAIGPANSWLIKQEAHDNEISYGTLRRAFCALRCESKKIAGSRYHEWAAAATGGFPARRVTGAEWDDCSRVEGDAMGEDFGHEGLADVASSEIVAGVCDTAEAKPGSETVPQCTPTASQVSPTIGQKLVEAAFENELRAHDERALAHASAHGLDAEEQEDFVDPEVLLQRFQARSLTSIRDRMLNEQRNARLTSPSDDRIGAVVDRDPRAAAATTGAADDDRSEEVFTRVGERGADGRRSLPATLEERTYHERALEHQFVHILEPRK